MYVSVQVETVAQWNCVHQRVTPLILTSRSVEASKRAKEAICTTRRACRADIPLWHLAHLGSTTSNDGGSDFIVRTFENHWTSTTYPSHISSDDWNNLIHNLLYSDLQPVFGWYIQHVTGLFKSASYLHDSHSCDLGLYESNQWGYRF